MADGLRVLGRWLPLKIKSPPSLAAKPWQGLDDKGGCFWEMSSVQIFSLSMRVQRGLFMAFRFANSCLARLRSGMGRSTPP